MPKLMSRKVSSANTLQAPLSVMAPLSALFSSSVLREFAKWGTSPRFTRLTRELSGVLENTRCVTVADVYELAFSELQATHSRPEYIYKSAIMQRILRGRHSIRTATMLTEFRTGVCKADAVVLNGTATVYEIKSSRDRLDRLTSQISAYERVFPNVVVVAAERHVADIKSLVSASVGICTLDSRCYLSTVRRPSARLDLLASDAIFDAVRVSEAQLILKGRGIALPNISNTELRSRLRELFSAIPSLDAHTEMVKVLRTTRCCIKLEPELQQLPEALHLATLSMPLTVTERSRLVSAMSCPLDCL